MAVVTMRELLEAGIHFGHQTRRWHPKMKRFIYGQRNGIYIVDLQQTLRQLYKAYGLVRDTVANGGIVLFVGTKRQAQEPIEREAKRCGMYYMNNRWLGGTLTNFQTVRRSIMELKELQELESSGRIEQYSKKEGIVFRKKREKLEKNLAGIQDMPRVPKVMFIIDAKREAIAVNEAKRLGIPCIGIVDTNCDPDVVSLPVPGNDDAIRAVSLYCKIIADAVIEGRMRAEKAAADEGEGQEASATAEVVAEAGEKTEEAAPAEAVENDAPAETDTPVEADGETAEVATDAAE